MEEEEEAVEGGEVVEKGMRGQTENRRWEDGESLSQKENHLPTEGLRMAVLDQFGYQLGINPVRGNAEEEKEEVGKQMKLCEG